jgi:hypothetical protein
MEGGSGFGDFFGQVQGLIFITIGAGIIWLFLTYLIFQRAGERRRRQRDGLAPLPSFFTQAYQYLTQEKPPDSSNTAPAMPDLDALTADLPSPNLDMLLEDFEVPPPTPVVVEPEAPPPVKAAEMPYEAVVPVKEPVVSNELTYVPGSNELPGDAIEMMRVWRDVSDGRLIIGMKDQLFAGLNEIQDAALRNRFKKLVQDLNQIASLPVYNSPPVSKPATPERPAAPAETGGIADEIETYLQAKLLSNPSLFGRSIHVHSGLGGGVSIEVDGQHYEAVSDVSDPEVRQFLQNIIQEWESKR